MKTILSLAALSLALVAGCAAQSASDDEQPVDDREGAMINNGGTSVGYTCDGLLCKCTGDVDCNDMAGVCGTIATCDETHEPVTCQCLKGIGARVGKGGGKGGKLTPIAPASTLTK